MTDKNAKKQDNLMKIYADLLNEHRAWLLPFDQQRLKKWEGFLKSNPEAAICEAATRKLLSEHGVDIEPSEDLSHGGPDFLCTKDGKHFYVEVTCITKEAATKRTKLDAEPQIDSPDSPPIWYQPPISQILEEIRNKTPQCKDLDKPCVIAISTLHFGIGFSCFGDKHVAEMVLTGTPYISWDIVRDAGKASKGYRQTTDLKDSGFIRPRKDRPYSIEEARKTISAVLLCSPRMNPPHATGILHPNPNYFFDRTLLPGIKFCRLVEGYKGGNLLVEWI